MGSEAREERPHVQGYEPDRDAGRRHGTGGRARRHRHRARAGRARHLLYVELLLRDRVAAMVADDQDTPMPKGAPAPPAAAPSASLGEWRRERGETLAWLPTLGPTELERASVSPSFGRITAREQIDEWAYHDLDHLRQLLAAIETDLYPRIGGYRRLYPPPFPAAASADDGQLPPASAPVGSD